MGRKVLHSMINVKDRCTLIDEMTNLMSGNHICTIAFCYNVDSPFAVSMGMISCLLERLKISSESWFPSFSILGPVHDVEIL